MKDFFSWLITSSANPKNTSLAVKGFLVILAAQGLHVLTAACAIAAICFAIEQAQIDHFVDAVEGFVFYGLTLVGIIAAVIGTIRKWWLGRWSSKE